jgi:polysaccharide deacetylase family protein (PEP-CTERM system associated)
MADWQHPEYSTAAAGVAASPLYCSRMDGIVNAISVDVEDYFHPTELAVSAPMDQWDTLPSRVEPATRRTLDLFAEAGVRGTFFILGWVAERHPALVREIAAAGHEIGCHSYWHRLVYDLTPEEFRADTERACGVIEAACGVRPRVYRAPSYSITRKSWWALEVLASLGFTHDSSVYPIVHDRYGVPGFDRHAVTIETPAGPLREVPVATVLLSGGQVSPIGGGGYLRLLPYRYTAAGLRRVNSDENAPSCLYFHPWEIDPDQPRLARGAVARWRTYWGLGGMEGKIRRLLHDFPFAPLCDVYPVGVTPV